MLSLLMLYVYTRDIHVSLYFAVLGLLPDVDLLLSKFGVKHRGLTHSILFLPVMILFSVVFGYLIRYPLEKSIIIGIILYISHFIADFLSGGLEIFPGKWIGIYKTNSEWDAIFSAICWLLLIVFLYFFEGKI